MSEIQEVQLSVPPSNIPEYEIKGLLLHVDNVSFQHSPQSSPILRGVTAAVYDLYQPGFTRGQVVGLLGPSGIGKTTLFNIMSGLVPPTSGQVLLHFNGDSGQPVQPGQVGVVSQHYLVFNHLRVLDNLVVAGRQAGLSKSEAKERGMYLLDHFGLASQAKRFPQQLSGGQRQRIAIAQQLMCSRNLLLMDEPFSGLDPIMKDKVTELILDVASMDEENTIVVVTHDIPAALTVADTLWLMGRERTEEGEIVFGARILEIHNLVDEEIAWRPGIKDDPRFHEYVRLLEDRFPNL